jgi:hypothetical protein
VSKQGRLHNTNRSTVSAAVGLMGFAVLAMILNGAWLFSQGSEEHLMEKLMMFETDLVVKLWNIVTAFWSVSIHFLLVFLVITSFMIAMTAK